MRPIKRTPPLTIAIPISLMSDIPHLREKTLKIGFIARAAAIFRINNILLFPDLYPQDQSRDAALIYSILSYIETPQYLRKHLIPFKKSLKYAGILSPLRTPHHPIHKHIKDLKPGNYREGVVMKTDKSHSYVNIGVEKLAILRETLLPPKSRITTKILDIHKKYPEISLVKKEEINIYWGYNVTVSTLPLRKMIEKERYDLTIMTSRYGKLFTDSIEEIKKKWKKAKKVLVVFGSPKEGLIKILKREKIKINNVADLVVNTIHQQGTVTVRTEEAIYATLAIINYIT